MFDEFIDNNKDEMIDAISTLIKYPSVSDESKAEDGAPFGIDCKNVLNETLSLAKNMGFRTKNVDGYCGYIEFGEGDELVGIIGHLDVVPASIDDGWDTPPFEPVIKDGKIYGRGSIDDKGPVIASLYAMKAVMENSKVSKRVRLILGLNEEKNWKCINYYKKVEEHPQISFSPDAMFPAIHAEKGIMSISLKHQFKLHDAEIISFNTNNNAMNVVPKYCEMKIQASHELDLKDYKNEMHNQDIKVEKQDNNIYVIKSYGVPGHAAFLEKGVNAITNLIRYINENFPVSYYESDEFKYLQKLFNLGVFEIESPEFLSRDDVASPTEFHDTSFVKDESGILTNNIAQIEYDEGFLILKTNLRIPVTYPLEDILDKYRNLSTIFSNITVEAFGKQEPLYVRKDDPLVEKLVDIYNLKVARRDQPIAIGGGTYARAFPNSISYGAVFPWEPDLCHQANEYAVIDNLILASKIYAEAIYSLAK